MEATSIDFPSLVYHNGRGYANQTFCCNISGSPVEIYHKSIPALRNSDVVATSNGWLVLHNFDKDLLCLCNSTTFETIPLPNLPLHEKLRSCLLLPVSSASPKALDFKVLLFWKITPSIMSLRLGDENWREIKYGDQLKDLGYEKRVFSGAFTCGGQIYARLLYWGRTCPGFMWSIEIVEEPVLGLVLSRTEGPEWNHPLSDEFHDYLFESCGEIFWVGLRTGRVTINEILVVEVNRLNFDTMGWERVTSLKDRAFFISGSYCLSCPASGSGSGCIYFTMSEDKKLYCYNIADETVSMSLPCPDLPTPWRSSPVWIMQQVRPKYDCTNHKEVEEDNCRKEFTEEKQSCGSDIPYAVAQAVTTHLTALDYTNFRSVSSLCRSLAPPTDWRKALTGSNINYNYAFPLLMFAEKDQSQYKFIDPRINDNRHYLMKIPNHLEDTVIRYSNHGWVLLSRGTTVHLYNPFTRDIIHHTYTGGHGEDIESLFFTLKPSDYRCFLISIYGFNHLKVTVSTIGPEGEGKNGSSKVLKNNMDFYTPDTSPVFFQDAFYYLDSTGDIGKLKIEDENNISWEVLEKIKKPCSFFRPNFLVECGGELLSVFIRNVGEKVGVYKLNQSRRVWETVTSLGNFALYLSRTSSYSVVTSTGLGNRIYLHSSLGNGIVFFSLDTGKWHSSGSRDSLSNLYGTKLHLNSCWIKPYW